LPNGRRLFLETTMAKKFRPRQRLRIIVNGVHLFVNAGQVPTLFGHRDQETAVREVISQMENEDLTGFGTTINDVHVQVDKLNG